MFGYDDAPQRVDVANIRGVERHHVEVKNDKVGYVSLAGRDGAAEHPWLW